MRLMIACLALLALSGCERSVYSGWSREKTAERADIADANARTALAQNEELQLKIEELREKLGELDNREERMTSATADDLDALNERLAQFEHVYNNHTH